MPVRYGFYGSGGQRAAEGAFSGLEDIGNTMIARQERDRQQQRELARQITKEMADRVIKGELQPNEAEQAMAGFGHPVRPGAFNAFQPSVTDRLHAAMGPVSGAKTPEDFPTMESTNLALQARNLNPMSFPTGTPANVADEGEPSLMKNIGDFIQPGSFDQTQPQGADVYQSVQDKLERIAASKPNPEVAAKGMMGTGAESQPTVTPNYLSPFKPVSQQLTASAGPIATGPTAGQQGGFQGSEALAAAPGKGAAEMQIENLTRPAKIETSRALEQSKIDTQTNPANTQAMARYEATIASARTRAELNARQAGFNLAPGLTTTTTGLQYIDLGKFEGQDKMFAARLAGNMPVVNDQDGSYLRDIDSARGTLAQAQEMYTHLSPQSYATLAGLKGASEAKINAELQADPQLAAIRSLSLGAIGLMRAVGGGRGLRVNRLEFENAASTIDPTGHFLMDSAPVFLQKIHNLGTMLYRNELVTVVKDRRQLADMMKDTYQTGPHDINLPKQ